MGKKKEVTEANIPPGKEEAWVWITQTPARRERVRKKRGKENSRIFEQEKTYVTLRKKKRRDILENWDGKSTGRCLPYRQKRIHENE